ncbi:TIGR00645 family protein [Salinibacterium sp. dk2585]|uniref:TIGR00645 family protein n=1 Tax=unclassified Salinibacterium TaxID=2632331 RepID=UPI0011C252B1|nr:MULTISPECIES: TIGR00645 family protein [unclassified Salinibacterium]QEE60933.1 TIGR00645 family protein [Salinibacterium sp. dk2585]TXK56004.1 TIGR00645 family protein [Salinibacterium sp. dk5596]
MTEPRSFRPQSPWVSGVGYLIFFSRWLQAPLYLGLIIAQIVYVIVFMVELWHLADHVLSDMAHIDEAIIMLGVLGLIDVVMIANLLIMVIIGGYETFVSKIKLEGHPDQPEWLSHVNANVLKVKLAMAIIGISSIHLLKTFIEVADLGGETESVTGNVYTESGVLWQVVIHMVFIVSAVALAWIDKISHGHLTPSAQQRPGTLEPVGPTMVEEREAQARRYEELARELRQS